MFVTLFRLFSEIFKHPTTQPAGGRDCRIDPDPKAAPLHRSGDGGPSFRPLPISKKTPSCHNLLILRFFMGHGVGNNSEETAKNSDGTANFRAETAI
jgi:hypothetical protein